MLALINTDEKVYDRNNNLLGSRVCYFYGESFDVAEPLFFIEVAENLSEKDSQFYYYDDTLHVVTEIPEEILPEKLLPVTEQIINNTQVEDIVQKLLQQKLKEYGIIAPSANTV